MAVSDGTSFIGRVFQRLRSMAELEADELRLASRGAGCTPISECEIGKRVVVGGRIRSVTLCPMVGVPQVQAEIYDGSGKVRLVWLGRRRIQGISAGREIKVVGRLTAANGQLSIFNPEYQLRPVPVGG